VYTRYTVQLELERNIEGMMINVLVYVVGMEQIESIAKWNVLQEGSVSVRSNDEMGRTNNGVKMNYVSKRCTVFAYIRFHNPHASALIWLVTTTRIPLYHGTWIEATLRPERKLNHACHPHLGLC
jgi:hypothetical protein